MKLKEDKNKFATQELTNDKDYVGLAVDPTYSKTISDSEKIKSILKDRFKEQEKNKEAFVKENQKTENKPKGTGDMKKMKLAESLFEVVDNDGFVQEPFETEKKLYKKAELLADNLGEFLNETSKINNLDDYLDEYDLDHIGKSMDALYSFAHSYAMVTDNEDVFEGLNKNTTAASDINKQLEEATTTLDRPQTAQLTKDSKPFYYKKKREPLADIIMSELTLGEDVYLISPEGKLIPTVAPSLNLDPTFDIGMGPDYEVVVNAPNDKVDDVIAIADKYDKEYTTSDRGRYKKIYIKLTPDEWETPYINPKFISVTDYKKSLKK